MHDIFRKDSDPLDDLLAPPPPADAEGLRNNLLERTVQVLRGRRRWRRLAWAVALAACYGAGLLTLHWAIPEPSRSHPEEVSSKPQATEPAGSPARTAVAVEWEAVDDPDRQTVLYQEAGDRYLEEERDPLQALRCYGNALDSGKEEDLTISASDSWLMMAIKDARQREKHNAKSGS